MTSSLLAFLAAALVPAQAHASGMPQDMAGFVSEICHPDQSDSNATPMDYFRFYNDNGNLMLVVSYANQAESAPISLSCGFFTGEFYSCCNDQSPGYNALINGRTG